MISPRPWRVIARKTDPQYTEDGSDMEVHEIVDANGEIVVETDSGVYPPRWDDAQFIVTAVNNYQVTPSQILHECSDG